MVAGTANLTGKSLQICDDLEQGRSVQKAAEKFGVSPRTDLTSAQICTEVSFGKSRDEARAAQGASVRRKLAPNQYSASRGTRRQATNHPTTKQGGSA